MAGDLVGYIGLVKVMRLTCIVLSTLLTPLSHRYSSFVGVLSLLLMFLRGLGRMGLLRARWDALPKSWNALCRHGPCGPIASFIPGMSGFLLSCMASVGGFLIPWSEGRWGA